MDKTKIEWTESTWNPVVGCSKVSAGCQNCYAERMVQRFPAMTGARKFGASPDSGDLDEGIGWDNRAHFLPHKLDTPLHWRKPRKVFVCSMGDLFHESVTDEQIAAIFGVMTACPHHTFQILTKRPKRMVEWFNWIDGFGKAWLLCGVKMLDHIEPPNDDFGPQTKTPWPLPNVWIGVSVEDQETADERIPLLLQVPAAKSFLSIEPMIGPVTLNLATKCDKMCSEHQEAWCPGTHGKCVCQQDIDWAICGAETGPGARPMHPSWPRMIRDQCKNANVPYFFKSWGEWALCGPLTSNRVDQLPLANNEIWLTIEGWDDLNGNDVHRMKRVGKKRSGRELDGVEHNAMPDGVAT